MRRPSVAAWRGSALVAGLLVLYWAIGPLVLVGLLIGATIPRVRRLLGLRRPGLMPSAMAVGIMLVITGLIAVVPDGVLPVPPGAGALVTPGYVGRPAIAAPLSLAVPQNPSLAPNGTGALHHDSWSTDAYDVPGPLGESPQVDTAWFGLTDCERLTFDVQGRLVGWCATVGGPVLQVIGPESMRPRASLELDDACEAPFYLDDRGRAVVGDDRTILVVETSDGRGEADLTVEATYELTELIDASDCLVAVLPDWSGRIWWATQDGVLGFVVPDTDRFRSLDLEESIGTSLSIDRVGGVYVVTDRALYRVGVDAAQRPEVSWRTIYDRGTGQKSGQEMQGSGTTPTLLPGGLVAITDNADPRMHVQFYLADTGRLVCQESVFDDGASATDGSLAAVEKSGVVVQNSAGDSGVRNALPGLAPAGGFARVDVVDGECRTIWTNDEAAPRSVSKVSLATGLVYAVTERSNYWGVNAWYLTAIDVRTGQRIWSVRTGIGLMSDPHGSAVTLGPEGSAYVVTASGLVRVRDRRFGSSTGS